MAYTFDDKDAPTRKPVQYFEMFGHRGLWADGWKAVTYHQFGHTLDDDVWELYHLDEDFSEIHNVADKYPEKLKELIELWWAEAGKHGVLPVDDQREALFGSQRRKGTPHGKRTYTYYPPVSHVPSEVAPTLGSRSWNMIVDIERDAADDQGALFVYGTQNQGLSLFIKDNNLMFDYNIFTTHHKVRSDMEVPVGRIPVGVKFQRQGNQGTITLIIDGQACGSIQVPFVIRMIGSTGMDIGLDRLSPVSDEYKDLAPFAFTGTIHRVDIDLPKYRPPGEAEEEAATRFKGEMAKQ
jgi:arylsulfatase